MHFKYLTEGSSIRIDVIFDDEKELTFNQADFITILPDYISHQHPYTITIKNHSLLLQPKDETVVLQLKDLHINLFETQAYTLLGTMLAEPLEIYSDKREEKREFGSSNASFQSAKEEKRDVGPGDSSYQSIQTQLLDPSKLKLLLEAAKQQKENLSVQISHVLDRGEDPTTLLSVDETFDSLIKEITKKLEHPNPAVSSETPSLLPARAAFKIFLFKKIEAAQQQGKTVCLFEPFYSYPDKLKSKDCLELSIHVVLQDSRHITPGGITAMPEAQAALQPLDDFIKAMNAVGCTAKLNKSGPNATSIQIEYDQNIKISPSQSKQMQEDYFEKCYNALAVVPSSYHEDVLRKALEEWNKIYPISEKSIEIYSTPTSASNHHLGRKPSKENDENKGDTSMIEEDSSLTITQ